MRTVKWTVFFLTTIAAATLYSGVLVAADDETEIMALNQRLLDAFNKRDLAAAMACFVNDERAVFFGDTIPLQTVGTSAFRKGIQEFITSSSQIHAEMKDVAILVGGDLAAAHYILPITWTDKNGIHTENGRYTQVLRKVDGKWLIWHEHLSVPYNPATGKAVLDAQP
jgi:uncharacterized protein (TIGR02246 family)